MKLVQCGILRNPERHQHYYDVSSGSCKYQTGYIEKKDNQWKMYMSALHVLVSQANGKHKFYFYGSFDDCVNEVKRLTGEDIEIIHRSDLTNEDKNHTI